MQSPITTYDFQVHQIVPTITVLRISESEDTTFLVALISVFVKLAFDFCSAFIKVARNRVQDMTLLAMMTEALKGEQDLDCRFHSDLTNHVGLISGAIVTMLFFCYDTPLQRLSPPCAERLRFISIRHTFLRTSIFLLGATAIDGIIFTRLLWKKRSAIQTVFPTDIDSGKYLRDDGAAGLSWRPSIGCAWVSAVAGGAVATGASVCI
ncbi:hypothetical protein DFJ73DRAFT_829238 [Zopfochytrium polystomum]|nr:hypothetical protein DFJ73DRAFT_829238 [Zopfochytrium polystomum]